MATTFVKIASVTVGSGGAANIEFTSIPNTYTDLVVFTSLRGSFSGEETVFVNFNSSSSNLSSRFLYGTGSSTSSGSDGSNLYFSRATGSGTTASTFSNGFNYITNYTGSTNKSVSSDYVTENNATAAIAWLDAGLWSNTAAITSIKLFMNAGNFVQHSTATLYGIKNS